MLARGRCWVTVQPHGSPGCATTRLSGSTKRAEHDQTLVVAPSDSDERLDLGEARIAELERQLAASHARTAELEAIVVKQAAQLEVLLEQLRRNSSNSHLPPSSDGSGATGTAGKKKSQSNRKRGGQKGRRDARRQLLPIE